jgi:hypothetical protein
VVQTTAQIPSPNSTGLTTIGTTTVTGGPHTRTLVFVDSYQSVPFGDPPEVTDVTGWVLLPTGATGGDVVYLEGGAATIDH